jgi:hypothetical protein
MLQPNEHISELVKLRVALLALVAWDERNVFMASCRR